MNRTIVKNVVIKIKELKRNITSLPVSIEDVIFNPFEILIWVIKSIAKKFLNKLVYLLNDDAINIG